eukprot:m.235694 g.235694  ORF g.235694 m.235694 type:complete len:373 (+) comp20214_c0_seq1:12-1130(+)
MAARAALSTASAGQTEVFECGEEIQPGLVDEQAAAGDVPFQVEYDPNDASAHAVKKEKKSLESLPNRFARLQENLKDLLREIEADKAANKAPVELATQLQALQAKLQQAKAAALSGEQVSLRDAPVLQQDLTNRLLASLNASKRAPASAAAPATAALAALAGGAPSTTVNPEGATFELYVRPDATAGDFATRFVQLDQQISRVERIIGNTSLAASATALEAASPSIVDVAAALAQQASHVAEEVVQELDKKIASYDTLKRLHATGIGSDYAKKVNDVYDSLRSWEAVASSIPLVLSRVRAVRSLHDQGANFETTLTKLAETQQQLTKALSEHRITASRCEGLLATSAVSIENHVNTLSQKMVAAEQAAARLA